MKERKEAAVGVFDSGIGGLTVAKEIIKNLPEENIVYFGDTARVPYGSKSRGTVIAYSRQIVNFLKTKDIKAIVIACNTASSLALDEIEAEISIPIIGVIKPGVKAAVQTSTNRRIGVIGTSSTIESGLYQRLLVEQDPQIRVFDKACPLLCPLAEEGWMDDPITDSVIERYLSSLLDRDIDTLILGCTHYPLLINAFRRITGNGIRLVNPAYETAVALKELLAQNDLLNESGKQPSYSFYSSDAPEKMLPVVKSILGCDAADYGQIPIDKY